MSYYQNNPLLSALNLGKTTHYSDHYDVSLLSAVPRSLNRTALSIQSDLPFVGADIWTLYELSWLNALGVPQVAIGEVILPATTPNIIESKSFKLYINSLNQSKFKNQQAVQQVLQRDLSQCAGGEVSITLLPLTDPRYQTIMQLEGHCLDQQDIYIDDYQFNEQILHNATDEPIVEERLVSHLLKSNCLITHQPDWGSLQIHYVGRKINHEALLRYIVSFRHHNEFHEQCVERIYCNLWHYCQPTKLFVYARYTRRGGLDINPYRASDPTLIPSIGRLIRQ